MNTETRHTGTERIRAIFSASRRGELNEVRKMLDECPQLVDAAMDFPGSWPYRFLRLISTVGRLGPPAGRTMPLLHRCILWRRADVAAELVRRGANVHAREQAVSTSALHFAAGKGFSDLCAQLIGAGAEVNARDAIGTTALRDAVLFDHCEVAQLLIQKGANVNNRDDSGWTALTLARSKGYAKMIDILVAAGAY